MASDYEDFFPCPSRTLLQRTFVGKHLRDVPAPAAILDKAIVERNCRQMLDSCRDLQVEFRPHVKTHKTNRVAKTAEVTQIQVGAISSAVNIVVSTVTEAEHLLEYLTECKDQGRSVNILYGIPLPPSQVQRLGQLGKKLGPRSVSVLVDHASQLQPLRAFKEIAGFGIGLYVKIDTGYHRAGLTANSPELKALISSICNEIEPPGYADLHGFYSHAGHSYGADSASAAMAILIEEIHGLESVADVANSMNMAKEVKGRYVLSVGATPTATSAQNLHLEPGIGQPKSVDENMKSLKDCLRHVGTKHTIEIHAGVYPILDMQQLATRGSPTARMTKSLESQQELSTADLALSVLAEVASLYESRDSPEALIAAGSLALGREPCKSSSGWGTVSDWGMSSRKITGRSGWQVGRISQEHGILTKDPSANGDVAHLSIGQKVRIWPNHACVAGAGFGWYLVVDSSLAPDRQDEVVDVWVRCRGW